MRICIVHNEYGKFSGEEVVVSGQKKLLSNNGHDVICFERSSAEIPQMLLGKLRAFLSGIYSFFSRRQIRKLLKKYKPDIVHIHNLFPLISPSILPECKRTKTPVVMTVHNYRLICPSGLFMNRGRICEKCSGGHEHWCILRNCEKNLFKSTGYALRNYIARKLRLFLDNVDIFICLTEFQKAKLVTEGFPADRCVVIPNMVELNSADFSFNPGDYVGFAGRVSYEKGITTLLEAAKKCPDIKVKAAGKCKGMTQQLKASLSNVDFVGHISAAALLEFYSHCRIVVLPSICYEGFPNTIIEAMFCGKPVICSRIGGLSKIVDEGVNGLLFEPGNADDLAEKISYLWSKPDLCKKMGQAGREKALNEYSPLKYYEKLMNAYQKAINLKEQVVCAK